MSNYNIALIPGDGIGPELTEATIKVLNAIQSKFEVDLNVIEVDAGDRCLENRGVALPKP